MDYGSPSGRVYNLNRLCLQRNIFEETGGHWYAFLMQNITIICYTCTCISWYDSPCEHIIDNTCCIQVKPETSYCSYCKTSWQARWYKMCVLFYHVCYQMFVICHTCSIAIWSYMLWHVCTFMAIKLFDLIELNFITSSIVYMEQLTRRDQVTHICFIVA